MEKILRQRERERKKMLGKREKRTDRQTKQGRIERVRQRKIGMRQTDR